MGRSAVPLLEGVHLIRGLLNAGLTVRVFLLLYELDASPSPGSLLGLRSPVSIYTPG